MTKGKKILFSFIAFIFGTFLFTIFVHYQFVYSLSVHFIRPEDYPLIGRYLPFYLYWGSVIGMIAVALTIFVTILSPTEVTSIKLNEDKGKLEIKKSAIIGLVQSQINQSSLLKDSKVKVKMYKKKIKIKIVGNTSSNIDIIDQTNQSIRKIDTYIKNFIGLDTSIKTEVTFKNVARSDDNKKEKKRVI